MIRFFPDWARSRSINSCSFPPTYHYYRMKSTQFESIIDLLNESLRQKVLYFVSSSSGANFLPTFFFFNYIIQRNRVDLLFVVGLTTKQCLSTESLSPSLLCLAIALPHAPLSTASFLHFSLDFVQSSSSSAS